MALLGILLGESKAGKSSSLRNLNKEDTFLIMPHTKKVYVKGSKRFDFKTKQGNVIIDGDIMKIPLYIKAISTKPEYAKFKTLVIDDINYFLQNYVLDREGVQKKGDTVFETYRMVAYYFHQIVKAVKEARPDLIVIMSGHTELSDSGKTKLKTVGKMADSLISIEGTTDYLIEAKYLPGKVDDCDYVIQTGAEGVFDSASVPFDWDLPKFLENDFKVIIDRMREDII